MEWAAPSPPPHGNFIGPVAAFRGPYEYSVPGSERDFIPQSEPPQEEHRTDTGGKRGDGVVEQQSSLSH